MTGAHVAVSTQEKNPRSAVVRTVVVAVVVLFPSMNAILGIIADELAPYGGVLPDWVFITLNAGVAVVTVILGIGTRVLAIPAVNAWLRDHARWLSPEDNPE